MSMLSACAPLESALTWIRLRVKILLSGVKSGILGQMLDADANSKMPKPIASLQTLTLEDDESAAALP